jgi:DNA topoisomerase III
MSILYICEKPAQARDIARNLKATNRQGGYLEGNGYQVTWCVGHLLELAPPEYYKPDVRPWRIEKLPVIPDTWTMLITPRTKKQFNVIKQLLKNTQHVVVAGDPDRAGEAIVREILDYCCYQGKIERLWLSALDDASIQKALKTLKSGDETKSLYEAEKARAASDYLLGLNLTMAASALYGVNGVLSIGRVQTPTLRLVVDRDRNIENFKPKDYFVLKALFSSDPQASFWATWQVPEAFQDESGHCLDQQMVESVAAKVDDEPGTIKDFKETNKKQKAPLCFALSDLQKRASSMFGYSAKQVLELAQSLYETHKATSYPRTDCRYLPEEQFEEVNQVLSALEQSDHEMKALTSLCDTQYRSSVWNNKKITAHHGIIPTMNEQVDIGKMSPEELNVYDLIRRQYLAQFMGDYEYQQRQVEVQCAGETFTATGNTPMKLGWKQAFKAVVNHGKNESENDTVIPVLAKGQAVENQETTVDSKQTKPPARLTEGTLIDAMKTVGKLVEDETLKKILKDSSGIGTEATRANILETLFKRDYLQRKAKQVISTEKGRALIDLVPEAIKNPLLTAQWEQKLEGIVEGRGDFNTFVAAQATLLKAILAQLQSDDTKKQAAALQLQSNTHNGKVYLCPKCQSPLRRLKSKKGKYFWGCGKYPDCDFTTWEKNAKPSL